MNGSTIAVVSSFKLLGVTLDNKLKFDMFTSELRKKILVKMYSIKKLHQLCYSVKLQFFKSFVLPYFEYCSTLSIYFTKTALQRMCNCFNMCMLKLFKINNEATNNSELNLHNNKLEKRSLFNFEHRLVSRISSFAHKILNNTNSPAVLKCMLVPNNNILGSESNFEPRQLRTKYLDTSTNKPIIINRRHPNALKEPRTAVSAGESTFAFFFAKFVNNICVEDIHQRFSFFKSIIFNNINRLFLKFVSIFPKFDLINKNFDYLLKKKPVT